MYTSQLVDIGVVAYFQCPTFVYYYFCSAVYFGICADHQSCILHECDGSCCGYRVVNAYEQTTCFGAEVYFSISFDVYVAFSDEDTPAKPYGIV